MYLFFALTLCGAFALNAVIKNLILIIHYGGGTTLVRLGVLISIQMAGVLKVQARLNQGACFD